MYEDATAQFADAYCIQSRLAIQLTKQGRYEEAVEHYRTAYELMPDSFGRVESHCFGCESVFEDARAQSIAEEVFAKLVVSEAGKPQVHYMLAYLRKIQGRYEEALEGFRRAVGIDPLYLNAWKQLYSLGEHVHMEPWERDLVALKLIELNPLRNHAKVKLAPVEDLAGLWRQAKRSIALRGERAKSLYPLAASVEAGKSVPAHQRILLDAYNGTGGVRLSDLAIPRSSVTRNDRGIRSDTHCRSCSKSLLGGKTSRNTYARGRKWLARKRQWTTLQ